MNELDIVYCKECKYYITENIDENSNMFYCKKHKSVSDNAELFYNKQCYRKRDSNKNNIKKVARWRKH